MTYWTSTTVICSSSTRFVEEKEKRAIHRMARRAGMAYHPLMHTTWRSVWTISTRSDCAAMTASMSL